MNPATIANIRANFEAEGKRRGYTQPFLSEYVEAAMDWWSRTGKKPDKPSASSYCTSDR